MRHLVGVIDNDQNDDVEGVDEKVVDHLQVGGLRHRVVDVGLHVGNDQHDRDGDHDPVLYVKQKTFNFQHFAFVQRIY